MSWASKWVFWVRGLFCRAEFAHGCVLVAPLREERPYPRRGMVAHEEHEIPERVAQGSCLRDAPCNDGDTSAPTITSEWLEPIAVAFIDPASTLPVLLPISYQEVGDRSGL